MNYSKYSEDDLMEAYSTMIDYSGKPNKEMLLEIEKRGGIESFLKRIENKKKNGKEINRIKNEVISLSKIHSDIELIKQSISSEIITKEELNYLIEIQFKDHQAMLDDRKIDSKTIGGSFMGILIGSCLGAIFLILTIYLFKQIAYFTIIGAYIICYFSIKLITNQSRNNTLVFIASIISTIISILLAVCITSLIIKVN